MIGYKLSIITKLEYDMDIDYWSVHDKFENDAHDIVDVIGGSNLVHSQHLARTVAAIFSNFEKF